MGFKAALPECKMEMINNLVKKLDQDKLQCFGLFVGLAKYKNKDTSKISRQVDLNDAINKIA